MISSYRIWNSLGLLIALALSCCAKAEIVGSFPDGYPGSGYGCERTCDDGDVNYVIRASLETYAVPGSEVLGTDNATLADGGDFLKTSANATISMFTRTFTGVANESSPFCASGGGDGTGGPLAPCLTVRPGQKMKIKVINDTEDGMLQLKQHKVWLEQYWDLAVEPGHPNLDSIDWFDAPPEDPEDFIITNEQDLPGWDTSFDWTNIHFHGMQVVPHLFYPQGTGDPSAPWISIKPKSEDPEQSCFCYVIDVPSDHPQGTFFWHIHRHGSVAMQAWQGMVGLLQVGDPKSKGSPDYTLTQNGITRDEPLILWEWAVEATTRIADTNTWFEGNFAITDDGPETITTFLTNNEYQPTFDMCVGETVHFRLLCAQTTTGSVIYVLNENDEVVPFHVFASDGINYGKTYEKSMLVVGPGQREGLLMQFETPGTYRIMQSIINDFQGDSEVDPDDNPDAPASFIVVSGTDCAEVTDTPVNISSLEFVPGMTGDINNTQITNQVSINFQVKSQLDRVPIPQFVIDGMEFDYRHITTTMNASTGSQWTLSSNMNYFHPFHIHVNPFQVQEMYSGYLPGSIANQNIIDAVKDTNLVPAGMWRDTVFIPPFGYTIIHQRFGESKAWTGKTVYHCHFLDHEDQGMIAAMMIADPANNESTTEPGPALRSTAGGEEVTLSSASGKSLGVTLGFVGGVLLGLCL